MTFRRNVCLLANRVPGMRKVSTSFTPTVLRNTTQQSTVLHINKLYETKKKIPDELWSEVLPSKSLKDAFPAQLCAFAEASVRHRKTPSVPLAHLFQRDEGLFTCTALVDLAYVCFKTNCFFRPAVEMVIKHLAQTGDISSVDASHCNAWGKAFTVLTYYVRATQRGPVYIEHPLLARVHTFLLANTRVGYVNLQELHNGWLGIERDAQKVDTLLISLANSYPHWQRGLATCVLHALQLQLPCAEELLRQLPHRHQPFHEILPLAVHCADNATSREVVVFLGSVEKFCTQHCETVHLEDVARLYVLFVSRRATRLHRVVERALLDPSRTSELQPETAALVLTTAPLRVTPGLLAVLLEPASLCTDVTLLSKLVATAASLRAVPPPLFQRVSLLAIEADQATDLACLMWAAAQSRSACTALAEHVATKPHSFFAVDDLIKVLGACVRMELPYESEGVHTVLQQTPLADWADDTLDIAATTLKPLLSPSYCSAVAQERRCRSQGK